MKAGNLNVNVLTKMVKRKVSIKSIVKMANYSQQLNTKLVLPSAVNVTTEMEQQRL